MHSAVQDFAREPSVENARALGEAIAELGETIVMLAPAPQERRRELVLSLVQSLAELAGAQRGG
jgi:hypothetical protein